MIPKIIYEDENLFVIDKPSGWITNSSNTTTTQPVIQKWLEENFTYKICGNQEIRSGIVHRLDKETSGLLVVAKDEEVFYKLQSEFKNRKVLKTYLALLHGKLANDSGNVTAEVGRLPWRRDRFGIVPGGRPSETNYKLVKFYPEERGGYSLVEFFPKTGRTHQIRIHAKYLGHAIVSDDFYAGRKTARNDRKFCPRLFLHAKSIEFTHPVTGKTVKYESELPNDLLEVLQRISTEVL